MAEVCPSSAEHMSEVESLAKDVSSNLTVAATIEEDGTDDALANFTVIDQPMTTEEATDVPRPADDAFEADKENNGVQHGGLQRRRRAVILKVFAVGTCLQTSRPAVPITRYLHPTITVHRWSNQAWWPTQSS